MYSLTCQWNKINIDNNNLSDGAHKYLICGNYILAQRFDSTWCGCTSWIVGVLWYELQLSTADYIPLYLIVMLKTSLPPFPGEHYNDVIMTTIASQITSLTIVYSIVYSDADQRKHQSSASLTGEFPAQMASYAENVSIWWHHHDVLNRFWVHACICSYTNTEYVM